MKGKEDTLYVLFSFLFSSLIEENVLLLYPFGILSRRILYFIFYFLLVIKGIKNSK